MSKTAQNSQKPRLATFAALAVIGLGVFFMGDWGYDRVMMNPDAAIEKCGKGNVKSLSTEGFYTRKITCFNAVKAAG